MERRQFPRFRVKFSVTLSFSRGRDAGEGTLANLSVGGACVASNKRVSQGDFVSLQIYVPGHEFPIVVQSAAVRWVRGVEFGVEFLKLTDEQRRRLDDLLAVVSEGQKPEGAPEPPPSRPKGKS
jgi:hypothetical protein